MNKKLKNDIILVAVILCVAAAGFVLWYFSAPSGNMAIVTIDGEVVYELPLSRDSETRVDSEGGYNIVAVKDGKVTVTEASCPDLICVHHRAVSLAGETIVCLPNKMVVEIAVQAEH